MYLVCHFIYTLYGDRFTSRYPSPGGDRNITTPSRRVASPPRLLITSAARLACHFQRLLVALGSLLGSPHRFQDLPASVPSPRRHRWNPADPPILAPYSLGRLLTQPHGSRRPPHHTDSGTAVCESCPGRVSLGERSGTLGSRRHLSALSGLS